MKNLNEMPEIMDTTDIMELFEISKAGAYRLMRKRGFPSFKILGRYTVQKKSLSKWLDRQEQYSSRNN